MPDANPGTMISDAMIAPNQSPLFNSPDAYGLRYESVEFDAEDGTTLRGWLITEGADKVIVQSHFGVQCNRGGWSPEGRGDQVPWQQDISFLRQTRFLAERGYSVLMYDMRGHGESDLGPIPWVSWGPEEAKDVIAAVDYASHRFPAASIGLLSICMGAASTTYAYGRENGLSSRGNVRAMIAVQPLLYSCFVEAMGMPEDMVRAGDEVSKVRLGFDMSEPNFVLEAPKVTVPTLVVQNKNDPWTQLSMVQDYYDALAVEKELKMLDIAPSRFAAYDYLGTHPEDLMPWFDKHM